MRHLVLIFLILSSVQLANAQDSTQDTNPRKYFVGGSFGLGIGSEMFNYRVTSTLGMNLGKYHAIGLNLTNRNSYFKDSKSVIGGNTVELFSRHNFITKKQYELFLNPYAGYSFNHASDDLINAEVFKKNNYYLGLGLGMTYNLSDKFRVVGRFSGLNYSENHKLKFGVGSTNLGFEYRF